LVELEGGKETGKKRMERLWLRSLRD